MGEAEADAGKNVNDDLLADAGDFAGARGALAKDDVAAEEAGEEGVEGPLRGVSTFGFIFLAYALKRSLGENMGGIPSFPGVGPKRFRASMESL